MPQKLLKKVLEIELRYENLILFLFSIILAYISLTPPYLDNLRLFIEEGGNWGYLGALVVGAFYSYTITTVPATAAVFVLGSDLNPFLIAFLGAFGSAFSDSIIFIITKRKLHKEVQRVENKFLSLKTIKWFHISIPVLAFLVVASPLPDELGVALMAIAGLKGKKFLIFSYAANFTGLLIIATLGQSLL